MKIDHSALRYLVPGFLFFFIVVLPVALLGFGMTPLSITLLEALFIPLGAVAVSILAELSMLYRLTRGYAKIKKEWYARISEIIGVQDSGKTVVKNLQFVDPGSDTAIRFQRSRWVAANYAAKSSYLCGVILASMASCRFVELMNWCHCYIPNCMLHRWQVGFGVLVSVVMFVGGRKLRNEYLDAIKKHNDGFCYIVANKKDAIKQYILALDEKKVAGK